MRHAVLVLFIQLSGALSSGCTLEFVDVSAEPQHREKLGQVCTSDSPLHALGVTRNDERDKKTDYVLVSELRLRGREFMFTESLPRGTTVQLVSAQACSNCPLEAQVRYLVTVSPQVAQAGDRPIFGRASAVNNGVLQCK